MKSILQQEIRDIQTENIEQSLLVFYYSLQNYISSVFAYGIDHVVSKKNLQVLFDYFKFLKEESKILRLLLRNHKKIDIDWALFLLSKLDERNEKMISYFYEVLDDFGGSILIHGEEYRFQRPLRSFSFITEDESIRNEVTGLLVAEKVLREYYSFEPSFWEYMSEHTIFYEGFDFSEEQWFYGVYPKFNSEKLLQSFQVRVPKIVSFDTLCVNVREYYRAYLYYQSFNQSITDDFELETLEEEKKFYNHYFRAKKKQFFE